MTTFIVVAVIAVLAIILGATQRKKIVLLFRSETNALVKKATSSVKVIELRISDLKKSVTTMIESAGELFAKEIEFKDRIEKFDKKVKDLHADAIKLAEAGKDKEAKQQLTLELTYKAQLDSMISNLEVISKAKAKLEVKISKVKNHIVLLELKITNLKARQATNDTLKKASSSAGGIFENSIEGSIDVAELEVNADENKLDYIEDQNDEESNDYSAEAEEAFKKLKEE